MEICYGIHSDSGIIQHSTNVETAGAAGCSNNHVEYLLYLLVLGRKYDHLLHAGNSHLKPEILSAGSIIKKSNMTISGARLRYLQHKYLST